MTNEEQAKRSAEIIHSFNGCNAGDVICILAAALQTAIYMGAQNKNDAMDMVRCVTDDMTMGMMMEYDAQGMFDDMLRMNRRQ